MRIQRNTWHTENDARQAVGALVCAECHRPLKYGQVDGEWVTLCTKSRFHRGLEPRSELSQGLPPGEPGEGGTEGH